MSAGGPPRPTDDTPPACAVGLVVNLERGELQ
jgi:hypothetical protein